jgi:pilus assembly protein CpaB
MNRNTRTLIVLAVAIVTAALASAAMYVVIIRVTRKPEPPKVFAVVARRDLHMGATVADGDVKIVEWPHDSLVDGAFKSIDEVRDQVLLADVLQNEPLTSGKLSKEGIGLTPQIADGYRAMSVKVNDVIGVAGFVTPGTRVDVVVTIRQNQDAKSRVVVQNVKVLTAGAKYDDADARKQGKPIPSTVVTLMVTPQDAERIAIAQTQGQIALALRNPLDGKAVATNGISSTQLMGSPAAAAPSTATTNAPRRPSARTGGTAPPPIASPPPPPLPKCEVVLIKAGKVQVQSCL